MDIFPPFNSFVILFVTLAFISFLFKTLQKYKKNPDVKKYPPGPWKLPLVGNIHQLVGAGLPHHVLRDMALKHGPLMQLQLGEIPLVIVSSPKLAKEVLKTLDPVFAGRPQMLAFKVLFYNCSDVICRTYDDYWRQMRKICVHELLNADTNRSLEPVRKEEGDRLITLVRNSQGKSFNLTAAISQYSLSVVCKAAFGSVCKDQDKFVELVSQMSSITSGFDLADLFPSFKILQFLSGMMPKLSKIHKKVDTFLEEVINEHIKNVASKETSKGKEDLIDSLLRAKHNSNLKLPVTNVNIKAVILDVFAAGLDTSTTTTIWAMSELIRNPQVMAKAQSEIREAFFGKESIDETCVFELKYLNMVIKETFRLHPPAPLLVPRECLEDCVVDGYTIPAMTKLMVNVWAIGRDPALWSDSDSFVPERFEDIAVDFTGNNFELIPFGAGRRICPGMALGLANVKLPLALLLYHFDWNLPADFGLKPEDFDMIESSGSTCGRKTDLFLIPTSHSTFVDRQ